jgi:D-tyrosyl-tRNA(Tyr) deacylase
MKLVVQRVTNASVEVDEKIVGEINEGLMVLVGFGVNDTQKEADYLAKKLTKLRIFPDAPRDHNRHISIV